MLTLLYCGKIIAMHFLQMNSITKGFLEAEQIVSVKIKILIALTITFQKGMLSVGIKNTF
jgi:hypothetical protein